MIDRTNPSQLRERLKAVGLWASKQLGQHFLIDRSVLSAAVEAAAVDKADTVLEIGPGPGVLTEILVERAGRVVAIELDPAAVQIIGEDFPSVELTQGDVISVLPEVVRDLGTYKVVANIPYQVTTPLLRLLLEGGAVRPVSATLLIQKEVAQRLAAKAKTGERGYLSVVAQYFAELTIVANVPPTAFWPEPKVHSAVIHMDIRTDRPLPEGEEREFFKFVKTFFVNPRKQLKNVLAGVRGISPEQVMAHFAELGLPATVRAQELNQDEWISLYRAAKGDK